MNIEGTCPLPVKPGMTVNQATKACYDSELAADTYEQQFEGWVDIEALEPGDPGRKIVCCVEDGKCVTVEMKYMEVGPDPRKVDTSGVSYAAWVSVADVSASKSLGARRLHQECRLRVL